MASLTDIRKAIQAFGSEYQNIQTVRLGRLDGSTVLSDKAGMLWARQWNGREIEVINRAGVGAKFDVRVLVGASKIQPSKWYILQEMEDYLQPVGGGHIAYHHEQHMLKGPDMLPVDRRQIIEFTVLVFDPALFIVQVYGGVSLTPLGVRRLASQLVDLSSYQVVFGAKFITLEVDEDLILTVNDTGAIFGSPLIADETLIPTPAAGQTMIAYILMYEGQTSLSIDDIRVLMPLSRVSKSSGIQINEADLDSPLAADEIGFWDVIDAVLKKITFEDFKELWFSDAEGDPSDVSNTVAADGTSLYASRRDHTHLNTHYLKIVMDPALSNPPVPVQTPDGTDYVYYET